jgi:hypothetical protein
MSVAVALAGLASGADVVKKLADALKALKGIEKWLIDQPKDAAAEMARVLTEIMKTTPTIDAAVGALLKVVDDAKPNLAPLAQVANKSWALEIQNLRPHCHDIRAIADRHLSQWLSQSGVKGADADQLRNFLNDIADGDDAYFRDLDVFAQNIANIAREAFQLSVQGQKEEALALIRKAAPALLDAQIEAADLANQLTQLQNEFRRQALGI